MAKEKLYSKVEEAEKMIKELCEKHPTVLWRVRPDTICVLGIENKKRGKKNKTLAKVVAIRGVEKAVMAFNNVNTRYVIELYWSDWNEWREYLKQWILVHELLHISEDIGSTIKHDCEDFRVLIDVVGVDWVNSDKLPNLMDGTVKFNVDLLPVSNEEEIDLKKVLKEEDDEEEKL